MNPNDIVPEIFDKVLAHHIYKLSLLMRRYFIDTLKEYSLTPEQWQILAIIFEKGDELPQTFLSKVMANDRHTISRTISVLIKNEWICKNMIDGNNKSYYLSLTKRARKEIPVIKNILDTNAKKRFKSLNKKEYDHFLNLTKKLITDFEDYL